LSFSIWLASVIGSAVLPSNTSMATGQQRPSRYLDDTSSSTSVPWVRWRLASVASIAGWHSNSQSSAS
jgi:hypothetical protein